MPVNNVFQMLAQQEIDRPQRELQMMQVQAQKAKLSQMMQEQAYQQKAQTDLAAMPQSTQTTTTLGSMAPQGQPFNPVAAPPQASMDPNAQGNSLAAMGLNVDPMQKTETKPLTLLEGFQREYNYHNANGRRDMAKQVLKDQFDYTIQVADFVDKLRKQQGGAETVTAWMKANPDVSSVLGEPSTIKVHKEGVWYPVTKDDSNDIIPGKFWSYDGKGGINQHEVKPETVQTFAPGVGIPDGKGGYTVPVPKEEKPEYKSRERKDGRRILFEESQDNGKTWKRVSESPIDKPQSVGGGTGTTGGTGGKPAAKVKPLPPKALSMQQDALDAIGISSGIQADVGGFINLIDDGKLDFGPVENIKSKTLNAIGKSTEKSANLTNFTTSLEKLRNDILMLAKGVQTDGDALRAYRTLMDNLNDKRVVKQQLEKISENNARNVKLQQAKIDTINANYGRDGADTAGYTSVKPALGKGTPKGKPAPKLSKAAQSIADRW